MHAGWPIRPWLQQWLPAQLRGRQCQQRHRLDPSHLGSPEALDSWAALRRPQQQQLPLQVRLPQEHQHRQSQQRKEQQQQHLRRS